MGKYRYRSTSGVTSIRPLHETRQQVSVPCEFYGCHLAKKKCCFPSILLNNDFQQTNKQRFQDNKLPEKPNFAALPSHTPTLTVAANRHIIAVKGKIRAVERIHRVTNQPMLRKD